MTDHLIANLRSTLSVSISVQKIIVHKKKDVSRKLSSLVRAPLFLISHLVFFVEAGFIQSRSAGKTRNPTLEELGVNMMVSTALEVPARNNGPSVDWLQTTQCFSAQTSAWHFVLRTNLFKWRAQSRGHFFSVLGPSHAKQARQVKNWVWEWCGWGGSRNLHGPQWARYLYF